MPNVTFNGNTYSCTKAYKGSDFIRLVDENGVLIVAFDGVSDFSGFSIADGSWSVPSEKNCCLATFNEDGTISRGGTVISSTVGTYTHSSGNLTGSGENGRFKATTTGTISSIKVNGTTCSVKCGGETSMDLVKGCWYTFILDGTTVNFNAGGAGGGLNFKVVGGTSAPASPSANTIWVNTSTTISDWVFSATQPTGAAGRVWILTGDSSNAAFNALKKNNITVYPLSAKQYVSGAWVDKTIKCYQNGWKDTLTELYIVKDGVPAYTFSKSSNMTLSQGSGYYQVGGSASGHHTTWVYDINLSAYKTLVIEGTFRVDSGFELCVWNNASSSPTYENHVATVDLTETGARLDVSGLQGEYAVGIATVYTHKQKIVNMYLK